MLRYLGIAAGTVVVIALVATAPMTLTGSGRAGLARIASSLASSREREVTVSGISGIWTGHLRVGYVVVADTQGPWLGVHGLELDWSPLALFRGRFAAGRLHADRIELARLPKSSSGSTSSSSAPGLPVAVDIARIDMPDILLGKEIAGSVVRIAAGGSLRAEGTPLALSTSFHVARADGTSGGLDGKVAFAMADNRLTVDVKGSESADGILANMLQIPGRPALDLTVSGDGPLSDWKGKASIDADGSVMAQLVAAYGRTAGGQHIAVTGSGAFGRFLPQSVRPLAEGNTAFDIAATIPARGGVSIERAKLQSDAVVAGATGAIDPAGISDLNVELSTRTGPVELTFGGGTAVGLSNVKLSVSGAGARPAIDGTVGLADLRAQGISLQGINAAINSGGFDLRGQTGPVTLKVDAAGASSDIASLAPLLAGALHAEAELDLAADTITIRSARLNDDVLKVDAKGTVGRSDGAISLAVSADAASSALPVAGRAALGERVTLQASVDRSASGDFEVKSMKLASGGLSADGRVVLSSGNIDASIKGALADLAPLAEGADGALAFSATASGKMSAPDMALELSSDRIEAAGRTITGLDLKATGVADPARPSADVKLSGKVGNDPLAGSATLRTEGAKRLVRNLSLTLANDRISGDLDLDEHFIPVGELTLSLPDIGPLAALALQKAAGDVEGTVRFTVTNGVPALKLDAKAGKITRDTLEVRNAALALAVDNYVAAAAISGNVRAEAIDSGGTAVRGAELSFEPDSGWTRFALKATANDVPANANGKLEFAGSDITVALDAAEATLRGLKTTLAAPSTIEVKGGTARFDRLGIAIGTGKAEVTGTAGEALDLKVALAKVPASAADAFVKGLGAGGTISGTVAVTGKASEPKVTYDVNWSDAATSQTSSAGLPPLGITSNGTFAAGKLSFQTGLSGSGLDLKGGGTVTVSGGPSFNLDFAGRAPFSLLAGQLASRGISLEGVADVKLAVSGTAAKPVISGGVQTTGAKLVDAQSGIAVKDLQADIALGGGVATIRKLTGQLLAGGTLTASGTVGIDPAAGLPADLAIKVANGRYTDGRIVTTTVDSEVTLKGPLASGPTISGRVDLGRTVITVPESMPASLSTLNVQHRNAPAAVARQAEAIKPATSSGGGGSTVVIDLDVRAPRQIFVSGRGLDAELGGSIHLAGTLGAPVAVGKFTMQRGRLNLLSRRLEFDSGTLGFTGSVIPDLDMTANTTIDSTTITVTVTGPATDPKFAFSSSPSLPEDEILAQLVFGKAMSKLSPLQIAQLADSAAALAGVGGSSSLLDSLRKDIGVDDIDVKTDSATGGTSLAVGKYLNDRTYVTIEKGTTAASGKATINLDVGRGLKLRGEATQEGEAKGGIYYEKDY